jgi:hypothetical protein
MVHRKTCISVSQCQGRQQVAKDCLVPSDPRNVGRVVCQSSIFVDIRDDDLLDWCKISAGEESTILGCA